MPVNGHGDRSELGELVAAVPAWARTEGPAAVARDTELGAHTVPFELKRREDPPDHQRRHSRWILGSALLAIIAVA
jgi:hypothetical protein